MGTDSRGSDFDRDFRPRRPGIRDRWQQVEQAFPDTAFPPIGLAEAHPELRIRFSRPVGYIELLETVQLHGYHLMLDEGRVLPRAEIARRWYADVYLPTVEAIQAEGLDEVCPDATYPDRFLWVRDRRRELMPEHGCRPLSEAARYATEQFARGRRGRRLLRV